MVKIKCTNNQCSNPNKNKIFLWDETRHIAPQCRVTGQHVAGAQKLIATCPFCHTQYTLFVVCPPTPPSGFGSGEIKFHKGVRKDDRRRVIEVPKHKRPRPQYDIPMPYGADE